MNRQLCRLRTENVQLSQRQATVVTGHKEELFKLKNQTFELSREKVNLVSQIHGLEEVIAELKQQLHQKAQQDVSSDCQPEVATHAQPDNGAATAIYEARSQLRSAHDEIFRLKNELTRSKLEVKARTEDAARHEQKYRALQETSVDYGKQLQTFQVNFVLFLLFPDSPNFPSVS